MSGAEHEPHGAAGSDRREAADLLLEAARRRARRWGGVAAVLIVLTAATLAWALQLRGLAHAAEQAAAEAGARRASLAVEASAAAQASQALQALQATQRAVEERADAQVRLAETERLRALADLESRSQREEIHRLRQQLLEREQRITVLTETIGTLQPSVVGGVEPVPVSRSSDRRVDAQTRALNEALSGAGVVVLEHGPIAEGVLPDVLLASLDERGVPRGAERWRAARVTIVDAVVQFVLEREAAQPPGSDAGALGGPDAHARAGAVDGAPQDGPPAEPPLERRTLRLPDAPAELWALAGLPLPEAGVMLVDVRAALAELLAHQPYEILALAGMRDGELLGLELRELDALGHEVRRLRADRALVQPQGPVLLLLDGDATASGVTRPFFRGKLIVPLPGAAYADWLAALFG